MRGLYWGFILVVLPLYIRLIPGGDLRFAKDGLFLWSALVGIGMFGARAFKWDVLLAFLPLSLLTFFNQYHPYSVVVYYQFIMVMGAWVVFAQVQDFGEKEWNQLPKFLWVSIFLSASWAAMNTFGRDPWDWIGLVRASVHDRKLMTTNHREVIGMLHQPSISAIFLTACLPFLLFLKNRWVQGLLLCLSLYTLYHFESAMSFLALTAAIWWAFTCRFKKTGLFIAAVGLLLLYLNLDAHYLFPGDRYKAWKAWVEYSSKQSDLRNWVGFGVGFIYDKFNTILPLNPIFRQLHNEFLDLHAAYGFTGIMLLGWMVLRIREWKGPYFLSFLILWVNSLGNLTFHISATTLLMILCYAKITQEPSKE